MEERRKNTFITQGVHFGDCLYKSIVGHFELAAKHNSAQHIVVAIDGTDFPAFVAPAPEEDFKEFLLEKWQEKTGKNELPADCSLTITNSETIKATLAEIDEEQKAGGPSPHITPLDDIHAPFRV